MVVRPEREAEVPLFRRRPNIDDIDDYDDNDVVETDTPASAAATAAPARPQGPWDVADVQDELERLDLGAILIPVPEGCEVRVDVQDDQVVAATLVDGRTALQVHAFAAPKTVGIWAEVRAEIIDSLRQSGGSAREADGPFGPELHAQIPTQVEGQGNQLQPARFLGVDGPRWFLRGLMTGAGAVDRAAARQMEEAFRGIVVVRGGEAMAPRDLLALRLPKEAMAHLPGAGAEQPAKPARPTLETLERGPEITETR
jgi:hypothetical protein